MMRLWVFAALLVCAAPGSLAAGQTVGRLDRSGAITVTGEIAEGATPDPGWVVLAPDNAALAKFRAARPERVAIDRLAFLNRFTPAERRALYAAAAKDLELQDWLTMYQAAGTIDLAGDKVRQGLDALVAAGILEAGRVRTILAAPAILTVP